MTFERAVSHVFKEEGYLSNDPDDNGGLTKYGISQKSYPNLDIKNFTIEQAKLIYKRDYWDKIQGDKLPENISFILMDMAVNIGYRKAIQLLQKACDTVQDGVIGPMTIKASAEPDIDRKLTKERIVYYASLDDFKKFGRGWTDRSLKTLLEA